MTRKLQQKKSTTLKIVVIGCGLSSEDITEQARKIVASAKTLVGGRRLLDYFPEFTSNKVLLAKNLRQTLAETVKKHRSGTLAILASGDALFFGVGKTLRELFPKEKIEFLPNVSAMQGACSRLGLSWENASFFSAHGKDAPLPWRQILLGAPVIIYGDENRPANNLAKELVSACPQCGLRPAALAENLGSAKERLVRGTLAAIAKVTCGGQSVLILLNNDSKIVSDSGMPLGLPENNFAHEAGLITSAELRAVALSKLRLGPGVMWDLGAGSGSVGIEAAALISGLKVFAVEQQASRCDDIAKNIEAFGLENVEVIEGDAERAIKHLPAPRAVFLGGGGKNAKKILRAAFAKLIPGGRLVASAVTLETVADFAETLPSFCTETVAVSVSRDKSVGGRRLMRAENSVSLFTYQKPDRKTI